MGRKRADWSRKVSVTMQGPRYVSFVASDDYYCGGAYPDTSTVALVFDLNTGGSVDWTKLLPELAQRTGADTAGDGSTTLGTVSSDRLSDLYKDLAKAAAAIRNTSTPLRKQSDPPLAGRKAGRLGRTAGLGACDRSLRTRASKSVETLRSLGVDAGFLKAIAAAHRQGGEDARCDIQFSPFISWRPLSERRSRSYQGRDPKGCSRGRPSQATGYGRAGEVGAARPVLDPS